MPRLVKQLLLASFALVSLGCATTAHSATATPDTGSGMSSSQPAKSVLAHCPAQEGESTRARYLRCKAAQNT